MKLFIFSIQVSFAVKGLTKTKFDSRYNLMASSFHRCAQIVFKNNHKVAASQRFGFYAILISSTVGNFIPPNQDKVKLARTFFSNFYLSFSPLFVNTSKFTDPSFIPLPLIFNPSIVFFFYLIGKS